MSARRRLSFCSSFLFETFDQEWNGYVAGKNQHHIWQMIQRGFGEKRGKDYHLWVYEHAKAPSQTVTRKYGTEAYFYGDAVETAADDLITEFENSAQSYIQKARSLPSGERLESSAIAAFVTHLEVRSLFIREEFSRLGGRLLEQLEKHFSNKRSLERMLKAYLINHPEKIDENLEKAGVPSAQWPIIKSMIEVNSDKIIGNNLNGVRAPIVQALAQLKPKIVDAAKSGHINGILQGFSDSERSKNHELLTFTVETTSAELLLPDTGLVFFTSKGPRPLSQRSDTIESVAVPIGANRYILGRSNGEAKKPEETLLRSLASCSFKSFVARTHSPDFERLTSRIGKNAKLISDIEVENLISLDDLLIV